ncbi:MAG: sensor histidine kinase [Flavobacteriales bacterium]|jgi:signal transduction histidine kinase
MDKYGISLVREGVELLSTHRVQFDFSLKRPGEVFLGQCKLTGARFKYVCNVQDGVYVVVTALDVGIKNREFVEIANGLRLVTSIMLSKSEQVQLNNVKKFRRLRHNVISQNAMILQELQYAFPVDELVSGAHEQQQSIERALTSNRRICSQAILKISKAANLMKAEIDVFDMLSGDGGVLDEHPHQIHRVITLSLQPFLLDFKEKGVVIEMGPCAEKVVIDFKSVAVCLTHFFDNALKYVDRDTRIKVDFRKLDEVIKVTFSMRSLAIADDERESVFSEGHSGKFAKKHGLNGDGIGLWFIRRIIMMNKGRFYFDSLDNRSSSVSNGGLPCSDNQFVFEFRLR